MKIKHIKRVFKDNGIYGVIFAINNIINKIYNMLFLRKSNMYADISTYIYGLKYIDVGGLRVGRDCRLEMITEYGTHVFNPFLKIGTNVVFNDRVHVACAQYIEIGSNSLFASNVFISDHNHGDYSKSLKKELSIIVEKRDLSLKPVKIGNNVWIGENVTILPGSEIGNNAVIGANSVVHGIIPPNCIALGVPAHVIKFVGD